MSDERFYFTQVPHWLVGHVSPRAIEVYTALGKWAKWDRDTGLGQAWPSLETIAATLHGAPSEKTVRRAIAELVTAGAVSTRRRFHTSNVYTLVGKEAEPFHVTDGNGKVRTPIDIDELGDGPDTNVRSSSDIYVRSIPDINVRENIDPGELDPVEPEDSSTIGEISFNRTNMSDLADRSNMSGLAAAEEIEF